MNRFFLSAQEISPNNSPCSSLDSSTGSVIIHENALTNTPVGSPNQRKFSKSKLSHDLVNYQERLTKSCDNLPFK